MSLSAAYFEALYARSDDPWSFRSRWYEQRKRSLLLASLPRERFACAFEPGCSNGELTVELAQRCDRVIASDSSARAVDLARQRTQAQANVAFRTGRIPEDWPPGLQDLVVLSEVAYYLDTPALQRLAARTRSSLAVDGVVVACHWRHRVPDYPQGGDAVHAGLAAALDLPRLARHVEADFLLEVWAADPRSVAQREGLA